MRKIITVCLAVIMLVSVTLSVVAAPGNFVKSPSTNPAPELIEGVNESEGCTAQLIITPYIERDTLPEEDRLIIEGVYKQIVESPDLSALTEDLIDVAAKLGVEVKDLAVSDLFDVRYIGCDIHQYHGIFRIKIKAETLDNFVCLLHFHEGEYHIVEDAKVTEDGDYLVFTTNKLSPFAIVVNTSEENPDAPQTNDLFPIYVSIAAVSGLMLIGLAITYKKERA